MKPIIKYSGGKTRELECIKKYIPSIFDRYIEPFIGGGALYWDLEKENSIINDLNVNLIQFYREICDQYPLIYSELEHLNKEYSENQSQYACDIELLGIENAKNKNSDLYYQLRKDFNDGVSDYSFATKYFFLNKTAYSGIVRFNSKREFNVPFGRYKNLSLSSLTEKHSNLLKKTKIYNSDYAFIFSLSKPKDFMFLDPPYDCVFSDYGNKDMINGFGENRHRKLADDFKLLECKALMVIGKTSLIEELYNGYIVGEYDVTYSMNSKNRISNQTKHLVICNY